ncbi:MAG: hypothetical protein ABEK12_01775, partial [Candidatus Nanohaloarchaea archaeon]
LLTGIGVLMPMATAATSVTRFFNTYFLPPTARVSGISGLIFGVLIPFGIVLIVLYLALDRTVGGREAKALAVLLSLFIIPSGGYRIISGALLAVFGLGNMTPGAGFGGVTVPGNLDPPLIAALVTGVGLAYMFHKQDESFAFWEYAITIGASLGM